MNIYEKLANIQQELKAPKNQHNKFGNYDFRSCEDILEAVKPLLNKHKLLLTITDEIVIFNERYYVKATAKLTDFETEQGMTFENVAFAREEENKKGMDASQVTGAASSYARKYALNGLFCIDDTKDPDTNEFGKTTKQNNTIKQVNSEKPKLISEAQRKRLFALGKGNNEAIKNVLTRHGYEKTETIKSEDYDKICTEIEAEVNM